MIRSRVTLAKIEAAAIEADLLSPLTIGRVGRPKEGARLPSTMIMSGGVASWERARDMARKVALRMLWRSISAGSAMPIPYSMDGVD